MAQKKIRGNSLKIYDREDKEFDDKKKPNVDLFSDTTHNIGHKSYPD
jgi:hypothetical protein